MTTPDTARRDCLACGGTFTVSAKNPRQRFCSQRCRAAAWRARQRQPFSDDVTNAVTTTNAANGVQRCPHCHQPLAVISVVVPAGAAVIHTPEVVPINPT